jgi:hypothetical protein
LPEKRSKNSTQFLFVAGRKVTAISFILLILIANVWFIYRLTGETMPEWTSFLFFPGVLGVLLGFFMMAPGWLNPSKLHQEQAEDAEYDKNRY